MNIFEKTFWSSLSKRVKIIGIATVACVLSVTIILLTFLNSTPKKSYFLYLKNRELYYTDLNNNVSFQVTEQLIDLDNAVNDSIYDEEFYLVEDKLLHHCKISNDGQVLFFIDNITDLDNGVPLYYRYLNNSKSNSQLIDPSVISYVLSESGRQITYLSGQESLLYQYNLKEKTKVDANVSSFIASPDGKKVVYCKNNEVYSKINDKQPQKLGDTTSDLYCNNDDFDNIYFKDNDLLYRIEDGEKVTQIASGVSSIVECYPTGKIYYLKENELEIPLADYLIDDAKSLDDAIEEPEYHSHPARWDYESDAEYQKALEEFEKKYQEDEQAQELWMQKRKRDYIRQDVQYETFAHTNSTLCYYDGKKEKVLKENLTLLELVGSDTAVPILIFKSADYKQLKKVRISQVESIDELKAKLESGLAELTVTHLAVKDVTSVIGFNEYRKYYITEDGKTVYFHDEIDDEKAIGNLYKMKISGKKPRKPKLYDSGVIYRTPTIYNNELFYFKNQNNGVAEFYRDGKKITDNAMLYNFSPVEAKNSCVYMTDWSYGDGGNLFIYENGKPKKIDQNVNRYSVTESGVVLYFKDCDYDFSTGDLYAYKDGKSQKIDQDVTNIINQIYFDSISAFNENLIIN